MTYDLIISGSEVFTVRIVCPSRGICLMGNSREIVKKSLREYMICKTSGSIFALLVILASCNAKMQGTASAEKNAFINNPFAFTILKNYSDNYSSIGRVLSSESSCPLQKENIADSSFCFLRTVEYDGLTIHIFSFDVIQGGTAEYIITGDTVSLKNGLAIGSSQEEVIRKLGKPYMRKDDLYIWRSTDLHNYLVFTVQEGAVTRIRWHEEREPSYKSKIVWDTKYE